MLTPNHMTILGTLLRDAGPEAVLAADRMLEAPPAQRPKILGEAIAVFGRDKDAVRVVAKYLDLPDWLGNEIKARNAAQKALELKL